MSIVDYEAIEHATRTLIDHIKNHEGIICISQDCIYHNPVGNGCEMKHIHLRKGICRFYKKGDPPPDRKDMAKDKMFY